jgi:hypothetical protein
MTAVPGIRLNATQRVLEALEGGLRRYGPLGGDDEWLVTALWLCTDSAAFIAFADGEGLTVCPAEEYLFRLARDLNATGDSNNACSVPAALPDPTDLECWPERTCTLSVVSGPSVGCGLLFGGAGGARVLVAGRPGSPALLYSDDPVEIARLCQDDDPMPVDAWFARRQPAPRQTRVLRSIKRSTAARSR